MRDLGHVALALKEFDLAEMYYETCMMHCSKNRLGMTLPIMVYWHLGFVIAAQRGAGSERRNVLSRR